MGRCCGAGPEAGSMDLPILLGNPGGTPRQVRLLTNLSDGHPAGSIVWVTGTEVDEVLAGGWIEEV